MRLTRKNLKVFAGEASDNGVFGSLQAEDPTLTNDVEEIQSLEAWGKGWNQSTMTSNELPPQEEFQGLQYVLSYEQAYVLQEGLAEWNQDTTYYKGGMVKVIDGQYFKIYNSLKDDNKSKVTSADWKLVFDSSLNYVDTTSDQTIGGVKTFSEVVKAKTPAGNSDTTDAATTEWTNDKLDTKQDKLSATQMNAVNSGITSGKVSQYDGYATSKQDKLTAGDGIDITNNVITNTRESAKWGKITGDISAQTDLQTALNKKANADDVVTLTTDQTIIGVKAFVGGINFKTTAQQIRENSGEITVGSNGFVIQGQGDGQIAIQSEGIKITADQMKTVSDKIVVDGTRPSLNAYVTSDPWAEKTGKLSYVATTEWIGDAIRPSLDCAGIAGSEFKSFSDFLSVWARDDRLKRVHIGDYFKLTTNAGTVGGVSIPAQTFTMRVAGIDTYYGCGDTEIGHHVDFISDEVINAEVHWNDSDCNNGTSAQNSPWLASKVYAWLNGVNNAGTAYGDKSVGGNFSGGGIRQLLPSDVRGAIIQKRQLLDTRYSGSSLLDYSNSWAWNDMGYLWLPNEIEVYGTQIRSNASQHQGWWNPEAQCSAQYPIFRTSCAARIKRISSGGRANWWLSSVVSYPAEGACLVDGSGGAGGFFTTFAGVRCPLCFRIG